MKRLILLLLCFIPLSASWIIKTEKIPDMVFQARVLDGNVVLQLKGPAEINGITEIFAVRDRRMDEVSDLIGSEKILITNESWGYRKWKPSQNGVWHFIAAIQTGKLGVNQRLFLIPCSNTVEVTDLPLDLNEKLGISNDMEMRLLNARSNKAGNEPTDQDMRRMKALIESIRDFHLEIRTKYFDKEEYDNLEVFAFLVRYTTITGELDSLYMTFLTKQYNWKYIPAINTEYTRLTKAVLETYKKIAADLQKQLE